MRRTEQVQGLRLMKFEEVYGRTHRGGLSQAEAAEVLGVSERTFRRWRDRYEAEGADGLYDRRLGRLSARRAPRRGRRGGGTVGSVRYQVPAFHRLALLGEAGCKARRHAQLQLGAADAPGARPGRAGAAARRAPPQAAAPADGRHDVAPGRLHAPMGAGSVLGPALLHGSDNSRKPPLPVIQAMRFV